VLSSLDYVCRQCFDNDEVILAEGKVGCHRGMWIFISASAVLPGPCSIVSTRRNHGGMGQPRSCWLRGPAPCGAQLWAASSAPGMYPLLDRWLLTIIHK